MDSVKPTKADFAKIAKPSATTVEYIVEGMDGLRVRVGARGQLSFSVLIRIDGKRKRIPIKPTEITKNALRAAVVEARDTAQVTADIGDRTLRTLGEKIIDDANLADSTRKIRLGHLDHLVRVFDNRLTDDAGRIFDAHRTLTRDPSAGPVAANNCIKTYRRIINVAGAAYNVKLEWPTLKIATLKMWNAEAPRSRKASHDEIPIIWEATEKMPDPWGRLLRFYMLTGFRNTEPLTGHIDGDDFIGNNKGKEFAIPVTPHMRELYGDGFVSPYTGRGVRNGKSITKYLKAETGLHFSPHDFRRLFGTVAEYAKIPQSTISQLYNHSTSASITQRYIGRNRLAMEAAVLLIDETFAQLVKRPDKVEDFSDPAVQEDIVKRLKGKRVKVKIKRPSGRFPRTGITIKS